MHLIIAISVGLDIDDCIEFFSNANANILRELRKRYDGRCYCGVKVLRVLSIERTGECVFSNPLTPTVGSLCVTFNALVIAIRPGDLISMCEFRSASPAIFSSEHAAVTIERGQRGVDAWESPISVLGRGSLICTVAKVISAGMFCSQAAVIGEVYYPARATWFFPFTAGTAEDAMNREALTCKKYARLSDVKSMSADSHIEACTVLEAAISAIGTFHAAREEMLSKNKEMGGKVINIVRSLFYPFKMESIGNREHAFETMNIAGFKIPRGATSLVIQRDVNPLDCQISFAVGNETPDMQKGCVSQSADQIIARFLEQTINYAIAGMDMMRAFQDPGRLKSIMAFVVLMSNKKEGLPQSSDKKKDIK